MLRRAASKLHLMHLFCLVTFQEHVVLASEKALVAQFEQWTALRSEAMVFEVAPQKCLLTTVLPAGSDHVLQHCYPGYLEVALSVGKAI